MPVFLNILFFVGGMVLLLVGAEWLVKGASSLAKRFNISEIVIGMTVVAFGTSTPELVVNIIAAGKGSSDIVFGNVIGSNNFNMLAILGISGLIYPLAVKSRTVKSEFPFMLFAVLLLLFLVNQYSWFGIRSNILGLAEGIALVVFFIIFNLYEFFHIAQDDAIETDPVDMLSRWKTAMYCILGLGGLIWGGDLVVNSAITIARHFRMSEQIIALTIVAAGTSLPELATSAVAAFRKKSDIAVGNIVGSTIFNILLVLGVSLIIHPLAYDPVMNVDMYIMLGASVLLLTAMFTGKNFKLDRWEAFIFLVIFLLYYFYNYMRYAYDLRLIDA
ncbi:MAG: calcium/sodium antiporter [Bacteroidia bacterium]